MKKYFISGLLPFLILFGLSYGLIKAADVEIILGTSSAFNVVRGTDVSSGTKMLYVGSSTVSIGTTTQSAMLTIAGSSTDTTGGLRVTNSSGTVTLNVRNDGAVFIGTNTSTLSSALYVGSATSGSLGTITAGFLSMGTISANAGLHGTTTVRFLADIFANGTITASKFSGDGAGITGITATGGVTGGNISTSGTISAGSTTVSTLTSTGSATVSGDLKVDTSTLVVDSTNNRVGIGTTTAQYAFQVNDGSTAAGFAVTNAGSVTATTIAAAGSVTVSGDLKVDTSTLVVDSANNRVGIGTTTPQYAFQVNDGSTAAGFAVTNAGSVTAMSIAATGSITVTGNGTITAGYLSIGTISASAAAGGHGTTTVRFLADIFANGTITASKFSGDGAGITGITATGGVTGGNISTSGTISAGSTTVSTLTSTGSATVSGDLKVDTSTLVVDSANNRVGIGTTTPQYSFQVNDGSTAAGFAVTNAGSVTATTIAATGSVTVSGDLKVDTSTLVVDSANNRVGIGTTTPQYAFQVTDSGALGVVVGSSGSITVTTLTTTGSLTVSGTITAATASGSRVGIGTTTPQSEFHVVGASGTPKSGTITAGFLSVGTITADLILHGTTAVHFPGGIYVTGSKSFLIPHPDPEKKGWLLRHCAVESPTRGDNLYRYKIVIPSDGGEVSFSLPTYWAHLNEEPVVWVSAVGQFAQGYGYVDEVTNTLVVKGEKKGIYNVLLIGTRKDLYAREFDARGVEFVDYEMSKLLTRGEKKDAVDVQLIDAHSDHVIKNFMDPIVDRFGLATHQ